MGMDRKSTREAAKKISVAGWFYLSDLSDSYAGLLYCVSMLGWFTGPQIEFRCVGRSILKTRMALGGKRETKFR